MPAINWKQFETDLIDKSLIAIRTVMNKKSEAFYAVAFHEFYAETGEIIARPWLAANTEEQLNGNEDSRWSSPDWKWKNIRYADAILKKLHRAIEKEAATGDEKYWNSIYARYVQAFVHVVKKLSAELRKHPRAEKDFGAFVFTEDDGNDDEVAVLQRCVTPAKFKKLFPHLHAAVESGNKLATSSLDDQLTSYRQDIYHYEKQILSLGDAAIPMLIDILKDKEQAWAAAGILGTLGIPDSRAIKALRSRAKSGDPLSVHDTAALALLGDVDYLLKLAKSPKTAAPAIDGISSLTSCLASNCRREIPLDYRPIECLLDDPTLNKSAAKRLNAGTPIAIAATDIDEALRGLESRHKAIRYHAANLLGERMLGKKAGERILPALALLLQDTDPGVRRITIVALSYWKKAARPWAEQIRKMFSDSNARVASFAREFLPAIENS